MCFIWVARDMKADQLPLGPWWNSLSESMKKNIDNFFGRYFIEKWVMRANPRDDARWRQFQKRFAKLEPTFQRTEYVFDIYGSDGNIRSRKRVFNLCVHHYFDEKSEESFMLSFWQFRQLKKKTTRFVYCNRTLAQKILVKSLARSTTTSKGDLTNWWIHL